MKNVADLTKICHPERSIAIGFFNRNAESRDLLLGATMNDGGLVEVSTGMWSREGWPASITTEGQEMQLPVSLKVFESPRHGTRLVANGEGFCDH